MGASKAALSDWLPLLAPSTSSSSWKSEANSSWHLPTKDCIWWEYQGLPLPNTGHFYQERSTRKGLLWSSCGSRRHQNHTQNCGRRPSLPSPAASSLSFPRGQPCLVDCKHSLLLSASSSYLSQMQFHNETSSISVLSCLHPRGCNSCWNSFQKSWGPFCPFIK